MKKFLAVYQATTVRSGGIEVSAGNIDVGALILDVATVRDWEGKIRNRIQADSVVITNVIPLER